VIGFIFYTNFFGGERSGDISLDDITDGDLFPFGEFGQDLTREDREGEIIGGGDRGGVDEDIPAYRKISFNPVAGAVWIPDTNSTTSSGIVRYSERATGHIFDANLDSETQRRISNTTVPKLYEVVWNNEGSAFVARYLAPDQIDTIESFLGILTFENPTSTEATLEGRFLPTNTIAVDTSPNGSEVFYLRNTSSEGSRGIIEPIDRPQKTRIVFNSEFKEWLVEWVANSHIAFTTKPSGSVGGHMYLFNTAQETFDRILGDVVGLTTKVHRDTNRVLFSESEGRDVELFILNRANSTRESLPNETFADKCVWSVVDTVIVYCAVPDQIPQGIYPDDWYQGKVSFNDSIWKINTETLGGELILTPRSYQEPPIDAINLFLSSNDSHLFFTNKKDSSLWSLEL